MKKYILTIGIVGGLSVFGCSTTETVIKLEPEVILKSNEYFEVSATPWCRSYGCEGFLLEIKNKTEKNIEIDWNKTLYINRGQTSGGFMFDGVVYKDRNNPKSPDIVFSKTSFSKIIWPNSLVSFGDVWVHNTMPNGENGVYLTVKIDDKEISQKLTTNIALSYVEK